MPIRCWGRERRPYNINEWLGNLLRLNPCDPAVEWLGENCLGVSLQDSWDKCGNGEWMLWVQQSVLVNTNRVLEAPFGEYASLWYTKATKGATCRECLDMVPPEERVGYIAYDEECAYCVSNMAELVRKDWECPTEKELHEAAANYTKIPLNRT